MTETTKTTINRLSDYIGQTVTLAGWVYHNRASGKVLFVVVRDGTGLCQCVVEAAGVSEAVFEAVKRLGQESSLTVTGTVRAEPRSPGGVELAVTDAAVICPTEEYPITPKEHGVEFLMRNRHLHLRSQRPWCIGRVRHTVIDAIRRFFQRQRVYAGRYTDLYRRGGRGRADAVCGRLFRPADVSVADGAVVSGKRGDEFWQGVLLRADIPRRKKQDPPTPDGVLDGRAGGGVY